MSAAPLQTFQWMIHFSCPLFPWYFRDASRSLQDYLPAALKRKWNIHTLILNRSTLRKPFWWQIWSPDFAMRSATLAKTQLPNLAINGKRCLLPKTISNFFLFFTWIMWLRWQRVLLQCRRLGIFWSGRSPGEGNGWLPTPVFLPGECHGQRSLAGCSPWGRKQLNWLSDFHFLSFLFFQCNFHSSNLKKDCKNILFERRT